MSRRKPAPPMFDHSELLSIAMAMHRMARTRAASVRYMRSRIDQGSPVWSVDELDRAAADANESRALAVKSLAAAFPTGPYAVDLMARWDAIFDETEAREREYGVEATP